MSTKNIIRQIAKIHGVSPKEAERDIKEAIRMGMSSTDPQAQTFWKEIAPDGSEPSIDTFLKHCTSKVYTKF